MKFVFWRATVLIVLLASLGIIYWLMSATLEQYTLITRQGEHLIKISGWHIFAELWVLMLPGILITGCIGGLALLWIIIKADNRDQAEKIAHYHSLACLAQEKTVQAESEANNRLAEQLDRAIQREHAATLREQKASTLIRTTQNQLESVIAEAQKQINIAKEESSNAETRRKNATATAERRRRKLEKIKLEQENRELTELFKS
ncbi:hypothetical protein [Pectobacterium sp. IFB5596]|uniref:hypothetical protein n=1 Tax=Pectobacterium sp. IFB5596 TaxID=1839803 RepID=UPI001F3FB775|nr:hypothetical protein [Pectobacterium sp. IFB5596]MCE9732755.1 hypothetical protein [Pectobacterium sp. IFB5596]GKW14028.1 hypothetical protein PEC301899_43100 [Pectobacterium carotovorum subsp. carotovorum]